MFDFLETFGGWLTGLLIIIAAVILLRHERRQARRLADRTRELEHLSQELLRVNHAKSEFLANVSHELRTPLNAIVGFADLLRDGVYGELTPRQTGPLQRIEASANHLRHLVDQILDLAKITAGRIDLHIETVNLRPFILDVASEIEPLATEKQLHLSLAVNTPLPKIQTDLTYLRQILVNLLANAVKNTPEGTITIRTRTTHTWIALQVSDTGTGIPQTDQSRIFDEFEQLNAGPRTNSPHRGTGLGLPISRRLARLLGGDVTLESSPGAGSTFTIWLPISQNTPAATIPTDFPSAP